jgi:hypothetical protein
LLTGHSKTGPLGACFNHVYSSGISFLGCLYGAYKPFAGYSSNIRMIKTENENIFFKDGLSNQSLIISYEIPAVIPKPKGIRMAILEIARTEDKPGNT